MYLKENTTIDLGLSLNGSNQIQASISRISKHVIILPELRLLLDVLLQLLHYLLFSLLVRLTLLGPSTDLIKEVFNICYLKT